MKHTIKTLKEYTEKLFGKEIANMSYEEVNKIMKEMNNGKKKVTRFKRY